MHPTADHRPPQPLIFEDQADAAPRRTVGVSNSSRAATAILVLFFLCEPSGLGGDHRHVMRPARKRRLVSVKVTVCFPTGKLRTKTAVLSFIAVSIPLPCA